MRNLPNILSMSRLIATIVVFILVLVNQSWAFLVATVIFIFASITDSLDGYLARRFKVVSSLGVFLDLTADKVFVTSILIAMVQIELVPAWIVAIIITREFMVTGLRSMASARGQVIPAGIWGKQKTFVTLLAVGGLLIAKGLSAQQASLFPPVLPLNNGGQILLLVADVLMMLATIWTVFSGIEYLIGACWLFQQNKEEQSKL
jgi:CDP-diacylglycerol--glycerol-3-phosphate 3-phosphatidyltransferase